MNNDKEQPIKTVMCRTNSNMNSPRKQYRDAFRFVRDENNQTLIKDHFITITSNQTNYSKDQLKKDIRLINKNTNNRYGTPSGLLNQKDKVYDRDVIQWWHNALQRTDIHCSDWKDAAENCPEDTFFFFDPPYRDSFANYNNAFSDDSLRELIQFCDNQSNVMLSNRDDDDWFQNECRTLNYIHFDIFYTAGRRKKTEEGYNAKKAREILLYNTIKEITLEAHLG